MPRIATTCFILLLCTGLSLHAQINIADIKIKDTLAFNAQNLKRLPNYMVDDANHAFSYNDTRFYYIKTFDENNLQYAVIKSGTGNNELKKFDISPWVQEVVQRIVDSGLCKAWQECFRLGFRSYHQFIVLDIHYTGETQHDAIMNKVIVFDPELKVIAEADDITPAYLLTRNHILAGSDSLFSEDLKGEELVSYKTPTPNTIYKAHENEVILWDRELNRFYSAVTSRDTILVYNLFDQHKPVIKIFGLLKSHPLFIDNNRLFISNNGNIYLINIETTAGMGYCIKPANYYVWPNKTGFFCEFDKNFNGDAGYTRAYSFISTADVMQ
jgi:hypothetical protein